MYRRYLVGLLAMFLVLFSSQAFALYVESVDLQTKLLVLPKQTERNTFQATSNSGPILLPEGRIELTMHINSDGEEYPDLPLRFGLQMPDGSCEDLLVWNSNSQRYEDVLHIQDVTADVAKSVAISLLLPDDLIERLRGYVMGSPENFHILYWIDGISAKINLADVHILDLSDSLNKFLSESEYPNYEKSYNKEFSNDNFGSSFSCSSHAWVDGNTGGSLNVNAEAKVTIFKNTFSFLKASGDALANPYNISDSHVELELRFLGDSIWSRRRDAELEWGDRKSFRKKKGYATVITIGPIPVKVEAGASGELGLQWDITVGKGLNGKIGPFVDIGAYATAGVDIGLASAGIKGTLSLIKDNFWSKVGCNMDPVESGLKGKLTYTITNDLSGADGKFGVFAKWYAGSPCTKHCCPWVGPCVCCGWTTKYDTRYYWFVDWSGWHRNWTLLDGVYPFGS